MNDAPDSPADAHTYVVGNEDDNARLDVFLCRHMKDLSRAKAKALAASGSVRIDGRRSKKGTRVASGQTVTLTEVPPPTDFAALTNDALPLDVRYEDDALLIVNKPAGMAMHPMRAEETDTLCNGLVARYPEMATVGYHPREPGILHRLDNDTSGLVMAARTKEAFDVLSQLLKAGRVDKRYQALVHGEPLWPRLFDAPIAHDPSDKRRMVACFDEREMARLGARPAATELLRAEPHRADPAIALVEVRAPSARRHQVRAHLAAFGHPLVGDTLYGGAGEGRHRLHASLLAFEGPSGKVHVESEPPADFTL